MVPEKVPEKVSVAPLVLLSVVDHYNRLAKDAKKRVVGVILGDNRSNTIRVANSFAVPFEEDSKNPEVWFLDHNYIEGMQEMFKKINANERLIGWYHSGPRLRASDLAINELFKRYTPNPLLLIVDIQPKDVGVPTDAYMAIDEIKSDGTSADKTFVHVPSEIKAEEAEEIGVEHLLRDVKSSVANGTLSSRIATQLASLQGLGGRLRDIGRYLDRVIDGSLPVNHAILGELQNVFNLLPNLSAAKNPDLEKAFTVNTNDQLMVVYLASAVRAIIAFHNMIENKLQNKDALNVEGEVH